MSITPDGPFEYMTGPGWDAMKRADKEFQDFRRKWNYQKRGNPMDNIEYLNLFVRQLQTKNLFMRAHTDAIAGQKLKSKYAHRQSVGKAYGRASRTIRELRDRLQSRAQFQREAIRNCKCGAWRRTRDELFELTEGENAP